LRLSSGEQLVTNTRLENQKHNRIISKKIPLLLFVLILGGIILPIGIISATARAKQDLLINKDDFRQFIKHPDSSAQEQLASPNSLELEVTKTHIPQVFIHGGTGKFIINITNTLAPSKVITNGITITDTLPIGLSINAIEHSNDWSCSPPPTSPITCTYPTTIEKSTEFEPITITVGADSITGTVTNSLIFTDNSNPTDSYTTTDTVTINSVNLKKTVSNSSPYEGERITYTISLKNQGPEDIHAVTISDTLPTGLSFISASPIGEYNSNTGIWTINDLAVTNSVTLNIVARVNSGIGSQTITNVAELFIDNVTTNITKTANINVQPSPDLIVSKIDGLDYVYPGYVFTYTISITNVGSIPAANVILTDVLGTDYSLITDTSGLSRTSVTANKFVWAPIPSIDPDKAKTFKIRVQTKSPLNSSLNLNNYVSVSTETEEGNSTNNFAEDTNTAVNLSIGKTVSPVSANVGTNLKFVITVKNNGNSNATNMVVTDLYPAVLDITRAVTTIGSATINNNNHTINVSVGTLAPGQTVTIYADARANSKAHGTKSYTNNAIVTASTPSGKPVLPNRSAKVSFTITGSSLPPTGGIPAYTKESLSPVANLALFIGITLGLFALLALFYAFLYWKKNPVWAPWFLRIGLLLMVSAFAIVFFSALLMWENIRPQTASNAEQTYPTLLSSESSEESILASIPFQEPYIPNPDGEIPETLPDYPIPTPSIENLPDNSPDKIDTSPITRIVIPAIGLDTIVKYVPFSDYTWLIAGLKQEIAWMGNTSWPGVGSNTGLAGHVTLRDGSVGPFYELGELQKGDEIILYTEEKVYQYIIREKTIVDDSNLSVVEPTSNPQITLITCADWDEAERIYKDRLIVFADLVNSSTFQAYIQQINDH